MKTITKIWFGISILYLGGITACSKRSNNPAPPVTPPADTTKSMVNSQVAFWLTNPDKTALFQQQNVALNFGSGLAVEPVITVDSTQTYQTIDGFGYALTGGSAQLIYSLPAAQRTALEQELFGTDTTHIGVSYLRVSIGASDMSARVFSYDDNASPSQPDTTLANFDLADDKTYLVPLLKEILAINPSIKILGCPWSAPLWMKNNNNSKAGSLLLQYYGVYANYFVRYIQAMKANGITIDAVTPQNEPLNPYNTPSMVMQDTSEERFVRDWMGPAFKAAGITTKIIIWDHNCDVASYPLTILADANAAQYVDGSAFHLYAGDISALSTVHNAYPNKNVYFTEQYVAGPGNFGSDLDWAIRNLIVGASRNWSRNVLEWNMAADPNYGPHTVGGCTVCQGAFTIDGSSVGRNTSYYIIAHASKFVRPGSLRISSNLTGNLQNVAFMTPAGKKVLIVLNDNTAAQTFTVQFNGKNFSTSLNAGAVGTYVW
ncbi:glycoside hydrolase family 30 protein [Puia dinghuensis]|uniref:Glucosylceramidase n=1 Tax=Puia dinghuensis TaxID=1792502 RepID=A0A8J2UGY9_9BACT|nr:glycoside hydrolase family 30 beta sandwich domain-containing protein [Puia dinghuensis]GGB16329.1 glucosylceramidase [Puia dinghuensis]